MKTKIWLNLFLILVGVVIGSLVADMTVGISWLKWLSYGLEFGTEAPLILNLNLLHLTFGITVRITVSMVIFIVLSLLIGRSIVRD
ncbi:MAG: DUF4321 domain-containing protein [Clostridia bacterium]|jgi:hypothetical protein|nr:DUF4321 domain-containing protein [Clostridia bacterium]MBQ3956688.1 DUF4321 domain-containing protein [Clostridia bacterium]